MVVAGGTRARGGHIVTDRAGTCGVVTTVGVLRELSVLLLVGVIGGVAVSARVVASSRAAAIDWSDRTARRGGATTGRTAAAETTDRLTWSLRCQLERLALR